MLPQIHVKLRKDKVKDNKCAIVLQVYFDKKQKQSFTGLYVDEKNFKDGEVVKHPNAFLYNTKIKNMIAELEERFLRQHLSGSDIDLNEKKTVSRKNFFEYGNKYYQDKKHTASPMYIIRGRYALDYFKAYAGNINFQAIKPQLLKDFEAHLFSKGLSRNYINGIFKRIRQVFHQAIREKIITDNPFDSFQPVTYQQPKREYLTIEEIEAINAADIDPRLHTIRDYFLLACYTGLRYSDMNKLEVVKNKGVSRLIIGTTKTGEMVSIKVTPTIKELLKRVKGKKLPSNQKTNEFLKLIGQVVGKPLTFHMARHSAAVNLASAGIPIEVVSRLLGHTSIRTTAIYYKITDTKLDDAMDQMEAYKNKPI